ncbi:MAG: reductive dehalogenase [Chloroflexi bacterium]|nr:reductive dehalogenase [Chloroflexota bacterium]
MTTKTVDTQTNHRTSVAEVYQVQPYYQRFNQKFNITRQRLWEPSMIRLTEERDASVARLLAEGKPGFGALDWAFYQASNGNLWNTGFSINAPNVRGNRWQPLTRGQPAQRGQGSPSRLSGATPSNAPAERWPGSPIEACRALRKVGRLFGADDVAFAPLDRRWVFSHYYDEETSKDYPIKFTDEPGYEHYAEPGLAEDKALVIPREVQYAVVMLFEMDEEGIARAPTAIQQGTVLTTYSRISFATVMVAEFLRWLGYHAIPSANCTALSIPLAIEAGLGQLGRNAKLINPRFGPRCRVAKVLTDLPVDVGSPRDFGVTEFCDVCKKCARLCPGQAIPYGERSFEPANECNSAGVLQWQMDHKKCAQFQARAGTNCGICLRVCPFNKGHSRVHDVTRFFIRNARWVDGILVRLDDALGFGRFKAPDAFWDGSR